MKIEVIEQLIIDSPAFHGWNAESSWNALPGTLRCIANHTAPGMVTCETGAGASTVAFVASGAWHTAISPYQHEHDRVRAYCDLAGVPTDRLTTIEGRSMDVLPTLEGPLDVAFIDGAHQFPVPIVDWAFVAGRIRIGGVLMLDDVPIPSVHVAYRFMATDPAWRLVETSDRRAAAFERVAEDASGDPWSQQPFNAGYPVTSWLPPRARAASLGQRGFAATKRQAKRLLKPQG